MKHPTLQKVMLTTMAVVASLALSAQAGQPKPVASETNPALPASCSWSAGPDLPSVGARVVGVYFPANGKFYGMGGRASDSFGGEFTHPFEYDPGTNAWTTKSATYPDTHVNNMACGVLNDAGTDYIYCVGGSQVTLPDIFDRVFRYDPVTDVISAVAAPWPGGLGMVLPGGFTVFNNKLYILGGFDTITGGGQGTNQIWEFTPPTTWVQKAAVLPVPLGYIPTTTIGSLIYTGGGSDITAGLLTDTTNSFVYNPVADSISTIASIPRATGETRALNFNGQMLVMGGGRTAPNPSNEVDVYDPGSDSWTVNTPVPAFVTARRNFPTDTDGTSLIWLAGGYDSSGVTLLASMEIFECNTGGNLTLVSAASRKTHGSKGSFDIPLPLTGNVGIECRTGLTRNTVVYTFNNAVTGADSASTSCGTIGSISVDPANAKNLLVTYNGGTCNKSTVTVTLTNVHDTMGNTLGTASASMGILTGDVTGDGKVKNGDISAVQAVQGQQTNSSNFRDDVTLDGRINNQDVQTVRSHRGDVLP